jgi:hypothetical protein
MSLWTAAKQQANGAAEMASGGIVPSGYHFFFIF